MLDFDSLLKQSQQVISSLIMRYLVSQNLKPLQDSVIAVIKATCETTDAIMDWKKSKKLIKSEKTR